MRVTVITPYRNFLVFFRATPHAIEVFRVIHGARDLDRVVDEIEIDFDDEESKRNQRGRGGIKGVGSLLVSVSC